MASVYAVAVPFIVALGLSDRTVAVNPKTKFWTNADEALSKKSGGRGVVDLEKLAEYNPTVLIHRSNDPDTVAAVENQTVEGYATEKHPKFEVYTDKAGESRFRLKAKNGQIIAASEGYSSMKSCLNGIESVKKNAPEAAIDEQI